MWRDRLLAEERELNATLEKAEETGDGSKQSEDAKEIASTRLAEVHEKLTEIDAQTGPVSRPQVVTASDPADELHSGSSGSPPVWSRLLDGRSIETDEVVQWWMEDASRAGAGAVRQA